MLAPVVGVDQLLLPRYPSLGFLHPGISVVEVRSDEHFDVADAHVVPFYQWAGVDVSNKTAGVLSITFWYLDEFLKGAELCDGPNRILRLLVEVGNIDLEVVPHLDRGLGLGPQVALGV